MSVNTKSTAKTAAAAKTEAAAPAAAPVKKQLLLLVLAMYQRYSDAGTLYEKNKVYAFDVETGTAKLQEEDNGRPIWRVYKEAKPEDAAGEAKPAIVDMTQPKAVVQEGAATATAKGLELGSAEEEAELGLDKLDGATSGTGTEVGTVATDAKGDTSGAVSL